MFICSVKIFCRNVFFSRIPSIFLTNKLVQNPNKFVIFSVNILCSFMILTAIQNFSSIYKIFILVKVILLRVSYFPRREL